MSTTKKKIALLVSTHFSRGKCEYFLDSRSGNLWRVATQPCASFDICGFVALSPTSGLWSLLAQFLSQLCHSSGVVLWKIHVKLRTGFPCVNHQHTRRRLTLCPALCMYACRRHTTHVLIKLACSPSSSCARHGTVRHGMAWHGMDRDFSPRSLPSGEVVVRHGQARDGRRGRGVPRGGGGAGGGRDHQGDGSSPRRRACLRLAVVHSLNAPESIPPVRVV